MYLRMGLFLGILLSGLFLPVWFFAVVVVFYTLSFDTYELVVIGLLIDGYFGEPAHSFAFTYTMITLGSVLMLRYIKPHVRFFTEG